MSGRCFSKCGSVMELPVIMFILVSCSIIFLLTAMVGNEINADFQNSTDLRNESKEVLNNFMGGFTSYFDGLFVLIFAFLVVAVIIGAAMIDTNPAVFFIALVLLILFILVSGFLANVYDDIATEPDVIGYVDEFKGMDFIMNNFAKMMLGVGFLIVAVMYMKSKGEGYG